MDSKTRSLKAAKNLAIHVYIILHVYVMFCILLFSSNLQMSYKQVYSAAHKVTGGGDQTKR